MIHLPPPAFNEKTFHAQAPQGAGWVPTGRQARPKPLPRQAALQSPSTEITPQQVKAAAQSSDSETETRRVRKQALISEEPDQFNTALNY